MNGSAEKAFLPCFLLKVEDIRYLINHLFFTFSTDLWP